MILRLDADGATPPYSQIHAQLSTMIRSGVLAPASRLPTIRHLANDLGIATGTVARAYHELEVDGLVVTRGRHGTSVVSEVPAPSPADDVTGAAAAFAVEATHRGLDLDQALEAVRSAFRSIDDHRRLA